MVDELECNESRKVAKVTLLDDDEPSTARAAGSYKPRGLVDPKHHTTPINTVIEDFIYEDEDTSSEPSEDFEDDLKFPGDGTESLVAIKASDVGILSRAVKAPRPGVNSLPPIIRRTFSEDFIPTVIEEIGSSSAPWQNLDVDKLQGCVNRIYPGFDYVVEKGDPLESSANARVMSFRNIIANAALANVQSFLKKFDKPELVEEYVRSGLIYHGEIPFLYRVFKPTDVPAPKSKERGGYKVTRQGLFQNQPILDTMLNYYGRRGIKQYLPTKSIPGGNPVGMLALICTAIERALCMHSTGHFIEDKRSFSEKFWGHRTAIYIKLVKDLSNSRWEVFYTGLAYSEGVQERLSECSKPVETWTNDPDEYFIAGSDPAGEE